MSEAELHFLKARMRGGVINKARRGELEMRPPIGLVYRDDGILILDPDTEVRSAMRLVFETFDLTGSAMQTAGRQAQPNQGSAVGIAVRDS